MNTEAFAKSKIIQFIFRMMGAAMESRFRYRFFSPIKILQGADIRPGQTVLEVGCGTGFFTLPAAQLIGDQGCFITMDMLPASIEMVSKKVKNAQLDNVYLFQGDAMNSGLEAQCMDAVLLFGVIPAPMLPLKRLLPEMGRILKPEGILAVWPGFPGWLPKAILRCGYFRLDSKRNGVFNFKRI
jgi:demethylmenaquinone methyltransferase/2-methoxy-6-polyprenyl-1,4-benzoquinol methylase